MKQKSVPGKAPADQVIKDIRRQTRRHYSAIPTNPATAPFRICPLIRHRAPWFFLGGGSFATSSASSFKSFSYRASAFAAAASDTATRLR
jgi:hypothetical protein